jgi:hypothetical protein
MGTSFRGVGVAYGDRNEYVASTLGSVPASELEVLPMKLPQPGSSISQTDTLTDVTRLVEN